jgi:5-oxoprolinase (ATP-hydrolysing)
MAQTSWQFWVDRGGTFTDVVARAPDGRLVTRKLLSQNPSRYPEAAVAGIRDVLGLEEGEPFCSDRVECVRMGTTVATNALLEREGDPTVLVVTRGFGDALRIGYQNRPRLFERRIRLPAPLYGRVLEVDERVTAEGVVLRAVDLRALEPQLLRAARDGFRAVAVVCLHSHVFPDHERAVGELAKSLGFEQVSCSAEVASLMRLVPRGDTCVVDAYLSGVLARYVQDVAPSLPGVRLMFMQSSGGLVRAGRFRGKDAVLSGPAGGIAGLAEVSRRSGCPRVIGFDMGGTSTDVSHYAGEFDRVFDTQVAGVRLCSPMVEIHTVAAGGGSILRFDQGRYQVGPASAGAVPGPACYRGGGPLTVTDANLLLGRIQPDHFPTVFGPDGDLPLDVSRTEELFDDLTRTICGQVAEPEAPEQVAEGFLRVAVANMANAVKRISVQKGHDITGYALTTFGGAGGQHACAVADALGMRSVLVPPLAGVLSALGIGLADTIALRTRSVEVRLSQGTVDRIREAADEAAGEALAELFDDGVPAERIEVKRRVRLRYEGTDTVLGVALARVAAMTEEFEALHRRLYSFTLDRPLIAEAVEAEAVGSIERPPVLCPAPGTAASAVPNKDALKSTVRMYHGGRWRRVPLRRREDLCAGDVVEGPAIVVEADSTTVVDDGWRAEAAVQGHLLLTRARERQDPDGATTAVDPVLLEIFNNLFMSIAEQTGARLEATAQSVNIRERRDFSCALFDPNGGLVANAPHIPVHLGSMGACVQELLRRHPQDLRPGDVFAVNDPFHGGTHLPDVTVITPVFAREGGSEGRGPAGRPERLFFVASRGHHAEIGGIAPGSMPSDSVTVHEEGVLFDDWRLVEGGRLRQAETLALLSCGAHPSRDPRTNLADLRAQIAANTKGVEEIGAMTDRFGVEVVQAYLRHVQDNAEEAVRRTVARLRDGGYRYETDSGQVIAVRVTVDRVGRNATIDFAGTSEQVPNNLNAPTAVVRAAVLYVFRTLVSEDIPLNDGCLRPLHLVIPPGSMLAPEPPAAVVAGNVETSQAVVGALYGALGVQAEGSGTMNNVCFGNDRFQYYETVACGSGAGDGFDGASAVQTHMTNSRLTDPEILESRFPVVLEEFSVRRDSGGQGRWRGGDGVVRRIRFTEPTCVSVLSSHRRVPPYPMAGGLPGALGCNRILRVDGTVTDLGGRGSASVGPGDVLEIRTPGGGGYGPAD